MNPVLNRDTDSTLFIKNVIKNGKERIDYFSEKANSIEQKQKKDASIFNLSIKQILENLSKTLIDLLTDVISGNISSIGDVFKGDRIIYLGIVMFFVALGIYVIST